MKKIIPLLTFCLLFLAASAQKNKTQTIVIKTQIYCDHCKECESCGGKIQTELYETKGIKSVSLNDKDMTITVIFNTKKISADAIRLKISKMGYDADSIKADPEAYAKLDGCCKK